MALGLKKGEWQFTRARSLLEILHHFELVAMLNQWSAKEKGLYSGVRLEGLLESVDISGGGRYQQLVGFLDQCYQPANQPYTTHTCSS